MPYVHHPSGKAAREIVAGRIVRFDDDGVAEVTLPHLLEQYASRDGYDVMDEPREQLHDLDDVAAEFGVDLDDGDEPDATY